MNIYRLSLFFTPVSFRRKIPLTTYVCCKFHRSCLSNEVLYHTYTSCKYILLVWFWNCPPLPFSIMHDFQSTFLIIQMSVSTRTSTLYTCGHFFLSRYMFFIYILVTCVWPGAGAETLIRLRLQPKLFFSSRLYNPALNDTKQGPQRWN